MKMIHHFNRITGLVTVVTGSNRTVTALKARITGVVTEVTVVTVNLQSIGVKFLCKKIKTIITPIIKKYCYKCYKCYKARMKRNISVTLLVTVL
jgi:hypothetical protein